LFITFRGSVALILLPKFDIRAGLSFTKISNCAIITKLINYIMFKLLYKKQKRAQTRKIFIFSLLSGFISAVAAIFLTPKTGKQMREMAVDSAKDAQKQVEKVSQEVTTKVKDWSEDTAEKAKELRTKALKASQDTFRVFNTGVDTVEDKTLEVIDNAKSEVKKAASKTKSTAKKVEDDVDSAVEDTNK
jgi:gas vesicle protein